MANPRNPRHLDLIIIFLQFLFLFPLSSALFLPTDNHLVDCGSNTVTTLHDHRLFLPDTNARSKISLAADATPALQISPIYQTARIFTSPSSYEFPIAGKGTHVIRLHFYPFSAGAHDLASSRFHVLASGFVLLSNFSATSDSLSVKEFIININEEKLVIEFVPDSSSFGFVNAIEVISAPPELIGDTARLVLPDKVLTFHGVSNQALGTLYRVNVGGPKVTPFNDTLWRTWIPDTGFFNSDSVSKILSFSSRIVYNKYGASREIAPDSVYNTARVIDSVSSSNLSSRMSWNFTVNNGYKYLIRMHFCDIASLALNELYFNVYINGYIAYEDFDISSATGQVLASPFYMDFVTDVGSSGVLNVSIGSSTYGDQWRVDGLLNGVEVMKMNNTVGSLDGELPVSMILRSARGGEVRAVVRSLTCWFALVTLSVIGFMLVLKWRAKSRNKIAWFPLPMDDSGVKISKGDILFNEN